MTHEVTLNGKAFKVERFKALKAVLAIASVTRISREVPDILARALKEYSSRNTISLTRDMARLPRWEGHGFTDEDFEAAPDGKIELPAASMSSQEQILVALPELFENARQETVRLLSILIVPNSELREADKEGGTPEVNEKLDQYKDLLLYDCDLDEVAELAAVAYEVLEDQLADKKDRLGKMVRTTARLLGRQLSTPESPTTPEEPLTSRTSSSSSPTSSTDLPTPTDGTETPLSTASAGVS